MEQEQQPIDYRQFMIFHVSELNLIDFNQVLETSAETVRKSLDGTKTFVKWDYPETPSCLVEKITWKEGPFTYNEILEILATPEWTDPNPNPTP